MKKLSIKEKVSLVMTLIFFFTTLGINIKKFEKDIKYISSTEINNKYNKKKNYNVKEHISSLWDTLGESLDYIENNVDNKEKTIETEKLIDDSIIALNSIQDALNKNYKNTSSNLVSYTRNMRAGFINLKEIIKKDTKSKEKILKIIEQNYIKAKKEKDF
ncbi:hypothetical protein [Clostridium botulinum]|uniref:hypothetical protein n=1 Tax=Clostridium botulinum TaxID=1491 RepID=UPI000D133556|nr:hypothetical protein [Clostridium botulinum]AVQ44395.1 hypothetical protein C7M60_00745 [Clostridium botulinum]AVQ47938.1 hypothetical protein C7M58_00740 [Clostridium botulinum]